MTQKLKFDHVDQPKVTKQQSITFIGIMIRHLTLEFSKLAGWLLSYDIRHGRQSLLTTSAMLTKHVTTQAVAVTTTNRFAESIIIMYIRSS